MTNWTSTKVIHPAFSNMFQVVHEQSMDFWLPSGYVKIAIENGHRNSGFSHSKWWFSIAFPTSPGAPCGGPHWRLLRVAAGLRQHGLVAPNGRGGEAAERVLRAGGGGVSAERHVDPGALEQHLRCHDFDPIWGGLMVIFRRIEGELYWLYVNIGCNRIRTRISLGFHTKLLCWSY